MYSEGLPSLDFRFSPKLSKYRGRQVRKYFGSFLRSQVGVHTAKNQLFRSCELGKTVLGAFKALPGVPKKSRKKFDFWVGGHFLVSPTRDVKISKIGDFWVRGLCALLNCEKSAGVRVHTLLPSERATSRLSKTVSGSSGDPLVAILGPCECKLPVAKRGQNGHFLYTQK